MIDGYWELRPWRPVEDAPMVLTSMMRALLSSQYAGVPREQWDVVRDRCIEPALRASTITIMSAHDCDDQAAGWVAVQVEPVCILHWVYVRRPMRGRGYARTLLEHACAGHIDDPWYAPYSTYAIERIRRVLPCLVVAPHVLEVT